MQMQAPVRKRSAAQFDGTAAAELQAKEAAADEEVEVEEKAAVTH